MFFPWNTKWKNPIGIRKDKHFLPARCGAIPARERRSPVINKKAQGSMTLEAALVLPLFLSVMLSVLQFARIMLVSSMLLCGMHSTAKEIAAYAYIRELGIVDTDSTAMELMAGGISAVYARGRIREVGGVTDDMGTWTLLQSKILQDEKVDLTAAYMPDQTLTLIPAPKIKARIRARVRAWTGRMHGGAGEGEEAEAEEEEERVLVTQTGHVYHTDENCTYLRLSIQSISRDSLANRRNASGGKYHACEKCGSGGTSNVYITTYGDRYHTSLECSGLKRTVESVPKSEVEGWDCCSKCAGSSP